MLVTAALAQRSSSAMCGPTVAYVTDGMPDMTAIAVGAFADPNFPSPEYSVHEGSKHCWVAMTGDDIEHYD